MSLLAGIVLSGVAIDELQTAAQLTASLDLPGLLPPRSWSDPTGLIVHRQSLSTPEDALERQPWVGPSGWVLVFDGRLDNRRDLIASLRPDGPEPPDGRLALAAVETWEDRAPQRLLGDFALAAWHPGQRRLLLARDHVGCRSLFIHRGAGLVAFASTPRALLALHPLVPRELDDEMLADMMVRTLHERSRTVWRGIDSLPGGCLAVARESKFSVESYWQALPTDCIRLASDHEYVEQARDLLQRSVRDRMRASGKIAVSLSSGLDSPAVAAAAARLATTGPLPALTLVPPGAWRNRDGPGWYADEGRLAEAFGRMHPAMKVELVDAGPGAEDEDVAGAYARFIGLPLRGAGPFDWPSALRRRARALGCSTVLDGACGNYAYSWDGLSELDALLHSGRLLAWAREIGALALASRRHPWRLMWTHGIRDLLPVRLARFLERLHGRRPAHWSTYSPIRPEFAVETRVDDRLTNDLRFAGRGPSTSAVRAFMVSGVSVMLEGTSARQQLSGLEFRHPMLDVRLLEFCLALPPEQFLQGGTARRLARRVLAGDAPPELVWNTRRGLQCPEWFERLDRRRSTLAGEIEALALSPLASRCLDVMRFRRLVADWPDSPESAEARRGLYRNVLPRAIAMGRFFRCVESGQL